MVKERSGEGRVPVAVVVVVIAWIALTAVFAPRSAEALRVVEHKTAQGGDRLEISCGEHISIERALPAEATAIDVRHPRAGDVVRDGFGDEELARIESVHVGADGGRPLVEIGVVSSGRTCDTPGLSWETGPVDYLIAYDVVTHPTVRVSDEQSGMHPRVRPREFTANADAGWKGLRWRTWGGGTATATGKFWATLWVPVGHQDVEERTFSYPVEVTLSKIRRCGSGDYLYTRISTRFKGKVPKEVRRQAYPLPSSGCLKAG